MMKHEHFHKCRIVFLSSLFCVGASSAAECYFDAKEGYFDDKTCWRGETMPTAEQDVVRIAADSVVTMREAPVAKFKYYLNWSTTTGATLRVLSGVKFAKLSLYVGQGSEGQTVTPTTPRTRLIIENGAEVENEVYGSDGREFMIYPGGRVEQRGGVVSGGGGILWNGAGGEYVMTGGTLDVKTIKTPEQASSGQLVFRATSSAVYGASSFYHYSGLVEIDGATSLSKTVLQMGAKNGSGTSVLRFKNATNSFDRLQVVGSSTSATGLVELVNSRVALAYDGTAALEMATSADSYSRVTVSNSTLWVVGNTNIGAADTVARPSPTADLIVQAGGNVGIGWNDADLDDAEFFNGGKRGLTIRNGGCLALQGGVCRVSTKLTASAGGRIVQSAGLLHTLQTTTAMQTSTIDLPFVYELSGGVFLCRESPCAWGDSSAGADKDKFPPPMRLVQTGGVFSNLVSGACVRLARDSVQNAARYEFAGGEIGPTPYFQTRSPGVVELVRRGSAGSAVIQGFDWAATAQEDVLMEFVPDMSAGHLAPWELTASTVQSRRAGNLRIRPQGGVFVSGTNTFTLLKTRGKAFNGTYDYRSLPDPSLWTVSLSADNRESLATLASPLATGALADGLAYTPESPAALGSVEVTRVRPDSIRCVYADLALRKPGGGAFSAGELESVAQTISEAGFEKVEIVDVSSGKVRLTIAPSGFVAGSNRFVWDFTRTVSAADASAGTVTTNALVSSVSLSARIRRGLVVIVR